MTKKLNLVCLHGHGQDASVFDNFEVPGCVKHAPHLPGHGRRKRGSVESFRDLVDAVYEDIKHLDNVVLLGTSLGGHICHHLLEKLSPIAVFTVCAPPLADARSVKMAYNPHPFVSYLFQESLNEIQASELARSMIGENHPQLQKLKEMILRTSPEIRSLLGASFTRGEFSNEQELLRQYRGKKVLIYPSEDPFISENYLKSLNVAPVKEIKGPELLTWSNQDQLKGFLSMVLFGT